MTVSIVKQAFVLVCVQLSVEQVRGCALGWRGSFPSHMQKQNTPQKSNTDRHGVQRAEKRR